MLRSLQIHKTVFKTWELKLERFTCTGSHSQVTQKAKVSLPRPSQSTMAASRSAFLRQTLVSILPQSRILMNFEILIFL